MLGTGDIGKKRHSFCPQGANVSGDKHIKRNLVLSMYFRNIGQTL